MPKAGLKLATALMVLLLPGLAQGGLLELTIDCSTQGSEKVYFNNPVGAPPAEVKLVTAAFRGFDPDDSHPTCADTSYWERRYPTIISSENEGTLGGGDLNLSSGSSRDEELGLFLPDNFTAPLGTKCSDVTTCPSRPASDCDHFILSVRVDYLAGGLPEQTTASCKNPSSGFPELVLPVDTLIEDRVDEDMVMATGVLPRGNSGDTTGDCMVGAQAGDISTSMLQNRSASRIYQGIYSGRFVCKVANDNTIGAGGICKSGAPSTPTSGRAIRGMFRGFRLGSDDCAGVRVNAALAGFPICCDCDQGTCDAPVVVQCGRGVVTGEAYASGSFSLYEPFIFLTPHLDLEPRTTRDHVTGAGGTPIPSLATLALACTDFSLSDIAGFTDIFAPFNEAENRFDFDYSQTLPKENDNCRARAIAEPLDPGNRIPFLGALNDLDQDGHFDTCQHLDVRRHRFSGGMGTSIRREIRNLFYEGTDATQPHPPTFLTHDDFDFAGNIVTVTPEQVDTEDPNYDEVLTFTTPAGFADPAENLEVVFSPMGQDPLFVVDKFEAADWIFAGAVDAGGVTSDMSGFSLVERAERDLLPAEDQQLRIPLAGGPVRSLASSDFGVKVLAGAGTKLYVYDSTGGAVVDFDPGTQPADPLELGRDIYGTAVEPDNAHAYIAVAGTSLSPGDGSFAIMELDQHALVSGTPGDPFIGTITGTPIDMVVHNLGAAGYRKAVAYVTSVLLGPDLCGSGGGGGGGGGGIEPLGGMTTMSGGATSRALLLSAYDLDRPNFATATKLSEFTLSCETYVEEELIEEVGLAMSASGQAFVVSPVMQRLRVFDADPATGALTSGTAALLGWTPTDVAVGPGPGATEVAVVVGYDPGTEDGKATIFNETSNLSNKTPVNFGVENPGPLVSAAIRFTGELAYVGDASKAEIRAVDLELAELEPGVVLTTPGAIRHLSVQRRLP